jgi:hypothetical protein
MYLVHNTKLLHCTQFRNAWNNFKNFVKHSQLPIGKTNSVTSAPNAQEAFFARLHFEIAKLEQMLPQQVGEPMPMSTGEAINEEPPSNAVAHEKLLDIKPEVKPSLTGPYLLLDLNSVEGMEDQGEEPPRV